ncbi:MAG: hypothetical protein ACN6RK_14655 [Stenotrophomonas sp.]
MAIKRIPEQFTDADGVIRMRVELARHGTKVVIDTADLEAIAAAGISLNWSLGPDGYPRVNVPGAGPCAVARLILGAKRGERVCYLDGNPLNLRGSNLTIARKRSAQARAAALAAFLTKQASARAAREVKA